MSKTRSGFPRFRGPFKTFSVSVSINYEKRTDSRLLVYSQGSRAKVVHYLWLKYLWDELTKDEWRLFYALPEILDSEIKIATLRAVMIQGKKRTRERLNIALKILGKESYTRTEYQGYKRLDVEISDFTRNLPKVPKFSGWIRSSSAKGSKKHQGGPSYLEPLALLESEYEMFEFNWYYILTVGDLEAFPSGDAEIILMRL